MRTASSTRNCQGPVSGCRPTGRCRIRPTGCTDSSGASRRSCRGPSIDAADVIGIGVDFTSCTVLPATAAGTPLCAARARSGPSGTRGRNCGSTTAAQRAGRSDHGGRGRARRSRGCRDTADASRRSGCFRKRWRSPTTRRGVYAAAERFLEGADWVVWQLTGVLTRNACAAGYKGTWHKREGHPSSEYLVAVKPGFEDLYVARAAAPVVSPGTAVGTADEGVERQARALSAGRRRGADHRCPRRGARRRCRRRQARSS